MNISSAPRKTSNKRKMTMIIIATLILLVGSAITYFILQQRAQDELKIAQPSNSAKNDIINSDKNNTSTPSEGLPEDSIDSTSDEVPTSSELSVSFSSTSQTNGLVQASVSTNGGGTCVFLYQPADGGKPVTRQVGVENNGCSVSISQNEFAYLGEWKLTATYYKDGNKAEVTQSVTIN